MLLASEYKIYTNILLKIQNYFSRAGCLHFVGNSPGTGFGERMGKLVAASPVLAGIPATIGYGINTEAKTGNYAVERMHEFASQNPTASDDQRYKVYTKSYKEFGNSSFAGRSLTKCGVLQPGAPEAVIDGYKVDLKNELDKLEKNNK